MMKSRVQMWSLILVLALAVPAARAQQQKDPRVNPPVAPLPPIPMNESSSRAPLDDPAPNPQNALKPDESPLSGAEAFTLGTSGGGRSYVTPSIRYTQVTDNTKRTTTSAADWRTNGNLTGNLSLLHIKSRSQFGIDYSAGGSLFSTANNHRGSFHRLGISEHISWRRVTLLLADSMTYLPESSFGSGGFGGISTGLGGFGNSGSGTGLGGGLGGFGGGLGGGSGSVIVPGQSILTGIGRRISNTAVAQIQYMVSPRASMTISGSHGMLRFLDGGFITSNNYRFSSGYDYKLNAADSIGVNYSSSMMRFSGINRSGNFHNVHLAYGRRLTGRLAMRLSGGPQFGTFTNPVAGSGHRTSWGLSSSLLYRFRNSNLSLDYLHRATSGSGVLVGADSDNFNGSLSRQLTRMWSGGLSFGFAHNNSIRQLNTAATTRTVNTWHAGLNLHRPLGRNAQLFLNYTASGQRATNPVGCTGVVCGRLPIRHHFGLGITWGFGPYAID